LPQKKPATVRRLSRTPTTVRNAIIGVLLGLAIASGLYAFGFAPRDISSPPSPAPTATASPRQGIESAKVSRTTIDGSRMTLVIPEEPNGSLVLWGHGNGEDAEIIISGKRLAILRDALLDEGYTLAAADAGGDAWGNPASVDAYVALDRWASEEAGTNNVVLVGQSMGGLATLQLIDALPRVRAWIGIYPACNLDSVAPGFPDATAAWKMSGTWATGVVKGMSPVVPKSVDGLDMLFFHSPDDTVVPKEPNTDTCSANAKAAGANVEVVATRGDHGDPMNFQPARVLSFLER